MVPAIRIGNDINLTWRFMYSEGGDPFPLDGKTLRILMKVNGKIIRVEECTVEGNCVSWYFRGKDQVELGSYDVEIVLDPEENGQIVHDERNAFRLVPHSDEEGDLSEQPGITVVRICSELGMDLGPVIFNCGTSTINV